MTLAIELAYWQQLLIKVLAILVIVPTATAIIVQTFLFKVMAHMQSRLGPMEAGPHGALQLMADGAKFVQKELLAPARADRRVFTLAPVVVLLSTFLLFVVIPAGPSIVAENLDLGIFFALAVSSISVLGVLMAGWASANKYALIGGLRAAGQLIAYELPLVLAVVGVVIQAGELSLQGIVRSQAEGDLRVRAHRAALRVHPVRRLRPVPRGHPGRAHPASLRHARGRVGAGGRLPGGVQRAAVPLLLPGRVRRRLRLLGLGRHHVPRGMVGPGLDLDGGLLSNVVGPVVLFAKTMAVAFLIFWIRFTYPRLREDQLQTFAWKYLIPLSLLNILVTGVFKVIF